MRTSNHWNLNTASASVRRSMGMGAWPLRFGVTNLASESERSETCPRACCTRVRPSRNALRGDVFFGWVRFDSVNRSVLWEPSHYAIHPGDPSSGATQARFPLVADRKPSRPTGGKMPSRHTQRPLGRSAFLCNPLPPLSATDFTAAAGETHRPRRSTRPSKTENDPPRSHAPLARCPPVCPNGESA